jgi:hypothetical protein
MIYDFMILCIPHTSGADKFNVFAKISGHRDQEPLHFRLIQLGAFYIVFSQNVQPTFYPRVCESLSDVMVEVKKCSGT